MSNPGEGKDAKEKHNMVKAARVTADGRARKPWICSRLVSASLFVGTSWKLCWHGACTSCTDINQKVGFVLSSGAT